jgi:hypothetical protein
VGRGSPLTFPFLSMVHSTQYTVHRSINIYSSVTGGGGSPFGFLFSSTVHSTQYTVHSTQVNKIYLYLSLRGSGWGFSFGFSFLSTVHSTQYTVHSTQVNKICRICGDSFLGPGKLCDFHREKNRLKSKKSKLVRRKRDGEASLTPQINDIAIAQRNIAWRRAQTDNVRYLSPFWVEVSPYLLCTYIVSTCVLCTVEKESKKGESLLKDKCMLSTCVLCTVYCVLCTVEKRRKRRKRKGDPPTPSHRQI